MKHAQIERLRALKQKMDDNRRMHLMCGVEATTSTGVEELVDILLMEREGMTDGVVVPLKGRIES